MKTNKPKILIIVVCSLVALIWSGAQCAESNDNKEFDAANPLDMKIGHVASQSQILLMKQILEQVSKDQRIIEIIDKDKVYFPRCFEKDANASTILRPLSETIYESETQEILRFIAQQGRELELTKLEVKKGEIEKAVQEEIIKNQREKFSALQEQMRLVEEQRKKEKEELFEKDRLALIEREKQLKSSNAIMESQLLQIRENAQQSVAQAEIIRQLQEKVNQAEELRKQNLDFPKYFNVDTYYSFNQDLVEYRREKGISEDPDLWGRWHYANHGRQEGRIYFPTDFNVDTYYCFNQDLVEYRREKGISEDPDLWGRWHYANHGRQEGRKYK